MRPSPFVLAQVVLTQDAGRLFAPAQAALEAEDGESAGWIARRAGALAPDQPWPYVVLGALAPDAPSAIHERRAHLLDPESDELLRRLGARLQALSDRDGVERAQRQILLRDPADTASLAMFMFARGWLGDAGAAANLARAARLEPSLAETAYTFGAALACDGETAAAVAIFASLARVALPPAGMSLPTAWPLEMVAAVKAGASLASVMIPDPALPHNAPEYVENYVFDHVILSANCLWALPQPFDIDPAGSSFSAFAYCGDPRIFARYWSSPGCQPGSPVMLYSYPRDAYKFFRFVVHHDHQLVYDSARPADTGDLDQAIRSGRALRLVMEAQDGLVHVLPVHLCFLYLESGAIRLTTQVRYAPEFCLYPTEALWPYHAYLLHRAGTLRTPPGSPGADGGEGESDPTRAELLKGASRLTLRRLTLSSDLVYRFFDLDGKEASATCRSFQIHMATPPR